MLTAIWTSALVGAVCAFLSAYLMLKGWSLIGDALSHSVVPGVAGAYILGLPYAFGAFISGGLAAAAMLFISQRSTLRNDAVIGLIFTGFFGLGLFMVSLSPTSVNVHTIIFGNILAISPLDALQLVLIAGVSMILLIIFWKDMMVVFFDESHARSIGYGRNSRCNCLFVNRSFPQTYSFKRHSRNTYSACWLVSKLFPRWLNWCHYCSPANITLSARFLFSTQAWDANESGKSPNRR